MAKIDWNTAQAELDNQENNGSGVGFFTLKNDNDFAIVRIMHDSPDDFDICAVHSIGEGKSFRTVSCLRDPSEPIAKCPLCAAGKKVSLRMYIHLIEYVKDEKTGEIKSFAKVWDRHTSYAKTLVQYMNEYGPLSDMVFKIVRHGKAGSTDTTYDIIFANPKVYAPELYPKNEQLFLGYNAEGTAVMKKTYEEMVAIANGAPVDNGNRGVANTPAQEPATYTPNPVVAPAYEPHPSAPVQEEPAIATHLNVASPYGSVPTRPTYNPAQAPAQEPSARPRRFY